MIEKSTFEFLSDLAKNNNKEWFQDNKKRYEAAKKNAIETADQIIAGITIFDPSIAGQEAKKCIFRVNRDIRFSKDKTPYKTNMAFAITSEGRKAHKPGYYLSIQPGGKSMIGGGTWAPDGKVLAAIRQEIDYNLDEFLQIIEGKTFKKYFKGLEDMNGDKLKTAPKGYPKDHPAIEILKNKHFIVMHPFEDKEVNDKKFVDNVVKVCREIKPLDDFLLRAMG